MNRSISAQNLVDCAIEEFATFGYDGASLAGIAEKVGIKKASIYAHFANKDSLFMAAFSDCMENEKTLMNQSFMDETDDDLPGFPYLENTISHYEKALAARFLLRTTFLCPPHLGAQIATFFEDYLNILKRNFENSLLKSKNYNIPPTELPRIVECFLAILDSVQIKLIYADIAAARSRLAALRYFFAFSLAPFKN